MLFPVAGQAELQEVDIIPNLPSIIVYSRKGYIKRMIAATFAVQSIRGIGKIKLTASKILAVYAFT